jgi:hypothetical protein
MKLRIQRNTVRVRLNDQEVAKLASGENIVEQTNFPSETLFYKIQLGAENDAQFVDNSITIDLNKDAVEQWASTDQISISIEMDGRDDKKLSILVEKDMKL